MDEFVLKATWQVNIRSIEKVYFQISFYETTENQCEVLQPSTLMSHTPIGSEHYKQSYSFICNFYLQVFY